MESSKGSGGKKPEGFFAGKGFYIVLFLCAAVIGVSAWTLASGEKTVSGAGRTDITVQADGEAPDVSLETAPGADEAMWEIPAGTEEVLAEAPEVASQEASVPTAPAEAASPRPADVQELAFAWPVAGQVELPYAVTYLLYDPTMGDWRTHSGVDIAAEVGTQVVAAAAGTVVAVYDDALYGTTVVIDHGGDLRSVYANLAAVPTVAAGDKVLLGDVIGAVGDTALCESSEGAHLHYAMKLTGQSVDPLEYLPAL